MNCPVCGRAWTESGAADCPNCTLVARRRELAPAMRGLARRVAAVEPPAELESALLAEFDQVHRRRTTRGWVAAFGALAACLLAGALLVRQQPPAAPLASTPMKNAEPASFLPIPYTQPIQPYERVMVVQTYVPVTALIAAGFQVRSSDPGASVQADVMVSQDGRPRAIRPITFISDRRLP